MTSTEGSVKVGILVSGFWKEGLSKKNTFQESVLQNDSEDDDDHQRHPTAEDTHRGKILPKAQRPKALSSLTHLTTLFQSKSFNKLSNIGQTSTDN